MSKVKSRFITILSVFAAFFLVLGLALALPARGTASAATYTPSNIFSAGVDGTVGATEEKGEGDNKESYVQFSLKNGGKVYFRRDLALKWYEQIPAADKPEEGDAGSESTQAEQASGLAPEYFSMTFAFETTEFEKLTVSFESAEENISKDAKATNRLVFTKKDGNVLVQVQAAGEEEPEGGVEVAADKDIEISLDEEGCAIGEFRVMLGGEEKQEVGRFKNIGGYFLEYRSSVSTTPSIPMTFEAELAEGAAADAKLDVAMKSLNKQSFKLDNGNVVDNAYPVLVLNEEIYAFTLGQRFNLTYEAIDVCDDSVTVTRNYYMAKQEDGKYVKPAEKKATSTSSEDKDDFKQLTTSTYFLPVDDSSAEEVEYVAIRFTLDDGTMPKIYSYLTWYAAETAVKTWGEGDDAYTYIRVDREKVGPKYIGVELKAPDTTAEEGSEAAKGTNEVTEVATAAAAAYQTALDEAAEKTSAGSGAYIYLPSLRGLIESESAGYRNLRYSIYYYKQSQTAGSGASSQTSLNYNALKLEVNEAGMYKFRVLAADAAGNNMQMYLDGELVTVSSSNIWDIEGIPEFTFEIKYTGATIEDPKEQDLGYRNDTYTFDSFEIIALSGYTTDYTLYRFDRDKLGDKAMPTYSSFVENAEQYVTKDYKDCLDVIHPFRDDVKESDAKWKDTDNDYHWNPDSNLSFMPKEAGFYVLEVNVTDAQLAGVVKTAYQVIEVRNPIDTIPGQSNWLEENVLSVVLFSISAVLAVIVVVLFLVKPSEKGVEEIDLEKLKGKKKKN